MSKSTTATNKKTSATLRLFLSDKIGDDTIPLGEITTTTDTQEVDLAKAKEQLRHRIAGELIAETI